MDPILELQVKTSRMLSLGFTLSIVWLLGVGSLIAVILGLKGRRIVKQSDGKIRGLKMAWWCIIVGSLETLIAIPMVLSLITTWLQ
jgi:hypothetical protein